MPALRHIYAELILLQKREILALTVIHYRRTSTFNIVGMSLIIHIDVFGCDVSTPEDKEGYEAIYFPFFPANCDRQILNAIGVHTLYIRENSWLAVH